MGKKLNERDLNIAVVGGGIVGTIIATKMHLDGHNTVIFDGQKVPGASRACTGLVDVEQAGDSVMLHLHKTYPLETRMVQVNENLRLFGVIDRHDIYKAFPGERRIRCDVSPVSLSEPKLFINADDLDVKEFDAVIFCLGAATNDVFEPLGFAMPGKLHRAFTGTLPEVQNDNISLSDDYREMRVTQDGKTKFSTLSLTPIRRPFPPVAELDCLVVQEKPALMNAGRDVWVGTGTGVCGIYYATQWALQLSDVYKKGVNRHDY
jgi:hypothetical protein